MATYIALKQIENADALLSASLIGTDFGSAIQDTLQTTILHDITIANLTLVPMDSDSYSLIVSGAIAVVDAENVADGNIGDNDSSVPAQIWINGETPPPIDPSVNGIAVSNVIDQGEW